MVEEVRLASFCWLNCEDLERFIDLRFMGLIRLISDLFLVLAGVFGFSGIGEHSSELFFSKESISFLLSAFF